MLSWCRRQDLPPCTACGRPLLVDMLERLVAADEDAIARRRVTDAERAAFEADMRLLNPRLLGDWIDQRIVTAYKQLVGLLELRREIEAREPTDPCPVVIEDAPGVLSGPGVERVIEIEMDDD